MRLKSLFKNKLLNILSLNAILVLVRLVTGFISVKAMALLIGPGGIALMGNFRSFLTAVQSLSSLGIRDGIVRFVSEKKHEENALKKVFSTALLIVLVLSLLVSGCIFLGSDRLNAYLFPGGSYAPVFKITAFLLPLSVLNIFLLAVLNGFQQYKRIILINSIANILGLGLILVLMWTFAVEGALIAAIAGESVILGVTLCFVRRSLFGNFRLSHYSGAYVRQLLRYSLMALVTAIVMPATFILVRNSITVHLSIDETGYWEALHRISGMYMLFVSSGLTLYYFPRLAELKTTAEFRHEIVNYYKTLVPLFLLAVSLIYLLREPLIRLALNESFMTVGTLLSWQLAGDLFKVMSLAFGYRILAGSMVRSYIFTEVLFGALFYLLTLYFLPFWGLSGVVKAYFVTNVINFLCMIVIFRKTIAAFFSPPSRS